MSFLPIALRATVESATSPFPASMCHSGIWVSLCQGMTIRPLLPTRGEVSKKYLLLGFKPLRSEKYEGCLLWLYNLVHFE